MKLAAGAAVVLAVGAGVGTYFALRGGPGVLPVPKEWQDPILERARVHGVIPGYRFVRINPGSSLQYVVADGNVGVTYYGCVGDASCPATITTLTIDYRHAAAAEAQAVERIARQQRPRMKIRFFEVTTLGG